MNKIIRECCVNCVDYQVLTKKVGYCPNWECNKMFNDNCLYFKDNTPFENHKNGDDLPNDMLIK